MSNIKFVSHESFPEDQYTKELVYLSVDDKFRFAYVRKQSRSGGMFWDIVNAAATKNGKKEYYDAVVMDSDFLKKDIKAFLEKRSWEKSVKYEENPPF